MPVSEKDKPVSDLVNNVLWSSFHGLNPVLGHLRGGPREPHFEQALRDPPPSPLQQRGGCSWADVRFDCCDQKEEEFLSLRLRRKKMGRPRAIATRPRMRDSLPVAHVPCVRALRGSMGRLGVAAAFQRRHGRIVTAAQVIASNGPPCALLHPHAAHLSRWLGSRQQAMLSSSRRV